MERLLQYCSKETGYEKQEVETIIGCFLDKISQELSEGHTVDLGSCFGIFSVKLRTGALCNIPPEQFSLWEWQDAVAYITEESLSFIETSRIWAKLSAFTPLIFKSSI